MDSSCDNRLMIGRIGFDVLSFQEALSRVMLLATSTRGAYVVTPNVDHVVRAEHDGSFARIANEADLVLADGMPLIWASRLLDRKLPMRIAGSDLAPAVCDAAASLGLSVFLLGGMPGEADLAAQKLRQKNPSLQVVGTVCPPFGFEHDAEECARIVELINQAKPSIVLVGVGSPKQEHWIYTWRDRLDAGVLIGVGATIGFMAGTLRRAPRMMQKIGAEWIYRLSQEPGRLVGRYVKDFEIFSIVVRTWFQSRKGQGAQDAKRRLATKSS